MARSSIQGLEHLQRKLKMLPLKAKQRISEAMVQAADEIVALMKSLVPVDTGALKESIGWTWGKAPKGALTVATVKGAEGDLLLTIYAGNSESFQARFVEFGTKAHTAGGLFAGAEIPAIPASPFFYVSFRALRRRSKARVTRAITKSAKEVAASR